MTPYDAKGMLNLALRGTDPVIFFESQQLYGEPEVLHESVPAGYYEIDEGAPCIHRQGDDLTILTVARTCTAPWKRRTSCPNATGWRQR